MANNNSKFLRSSLQIFSSSSARRCFQNRRLFSNVMLVQKLNFTTIWDQAVQLDFVTPNNLVAYGCWEGASWARRKRHQPSSCNCRFLGRCQEEEKNQNTSCFSFVIPTPHAKGTHHFGSFQDLTDWPIWQEQVHVVVESHAFFSAESQL